MVAGMLVGISLLVMAVLVGGRPGVHEEFGETMAARAAAAVWLLMEPFEALVDCRRLLASVPLAFQAGKSNHEVQSLRIPYTESALLLIRLHRWKQPEFPLFQTAVGMSCIRRGGWRWDYGIGRCSGLRCGSMPSG